MPSCALYQAWVLQQQLQPQILAVTCMGTCYSYFAAIAGPAKIGQMSSEVVAGCAIRKGESDPPIKPDSAYPAWLFDMLKPEPTVAELERMYATEGLELPQLKRLLRLKNKMRIKEQNAARAKK
eukprot:GHRR01009238.1.p1 GENE.GHRR01009238.1~~GHRR01009238.1.p1  ORF type:complete len:124 (+),score=33.20 GHRR01009238.1:53-424(+)